MRSRFIASALVAAALLAVDVSGSAGAQSLVDPRSRDRGRDAGGMSMDEAVRMVESRYRARAVKADPVDNGGRRVYEIRLLNAEGKVWKVRVDAETGQVL